MNTRTVQIRRSVAMVSLAAALAIGGALAFAISSGNHTVFGASRTLTLKVADSAPAPAVTGALRDSFADVVEPLLPSVVNISTSKVVKNTSGSGGQNPFGDDPFFRQFFGQNPFGGGGGQDQPREQREHSLGSGVIVSPDGYILTNNHVVDGASDIEVTLHNKQQLKAKLVGADPRTDIAVVKIEASDLKPITLGESAKLRVGDIVLAIGEPFGLSESVTMGIVSATSRRDVGIEGNGGYEDFIQTDAAINPGNSGGALVNASGQLIGVNTAIISNGNGEEGGNEGIGFAVPIDMARRVMEQLVKNGKVTRGYLGVLIQPITPDLAKAFGLPSAEGALVGDVTADSPGAKAGLQKGDVIVTLNGTAVADSYDLRLRISQTPPGQVAKLDVIRGGQKRQIDVTLAEYPEKAEAEATSEQGENAMTGVQVDALTPDILQQLSLPMGTHGVVITRVDPDSPAADVGLQRGDVIQEVNRKPIATVQQFQDAIHAAGNESVLLLINRQGQTSYTVLAPRQ
jgi:serine protease Do